MVSDVRGRALLYGSAIGVTLYSARGHHLHSIRIQSVNRLCEETTASDTKTRNGRHDDAGKNRRGKALKAASYRLFSSYIAKEPSVIDCLSTSIQEQLPSLIMMIHTRMFTYFFRKF